MASKKKGVTAARHHLGCIIFGLDSQVQWMVQQGRIWEVQHIVSKGQEGLSSKNSQGTAFDLQVQLYDNEQGKASCEDDKNVEDYVLPFTMMNDFDDEDDKDASVAPGRLAAAEEESFRREATQQSSPGAATYSV